MNGTERTADAYEEARVVAGPVNRDRVEGKYGSEMCDCCGGVFPVDLEPHGVRPNLCRDCERVGA